ncbi:MAG: hypothetical protein NHB14_27115 [Desulfosporosinus sp.]|nr:hypothetical protein [Desulfosporosinus sp.]
MPSLCNSLNKKIQFPLFTIANDIWRQKVYPNQPLNTKNIPFIENASNSLDIVEAIPLLGKILKSISLIFKAYSAIKIKLIKKEISLRRLEQMEPHQIEERLPMFWAEDVKAFLQSRKASTLVIFVDTYEALWANERKSGYYNSRDAWIRELISQLPFPENVLWVISGTERLRWQQTDNEWEKYLVQLPIGNLLVEDIKYLLEVNGITESDIQDAISVSSEGYPYYIELSIDIYRKIKKNNRVPSKNDFSGTPNEIQERFLQNLIDTEKYALKVLSAPRFWDRALFDTLYTSIQYWLPGKPVFPI